MTAEVVKLRPGDEPAEVCRWASDECADVLILGYDKDGEFYVAGSKRFGDGREALWLVEQFKSQLLAGDFQE